MELERLYRDIVEASPDGIWVIDLDGRTVFANSEIARIHGISQSELSTLTVFDTLDETGRAQFAQHLDEVRAGRTNAHDVEVQWVRRDGSPVWMLCGETALRDESGRAALLLHRYSDYTERRAALEALRRSEEALEDQMRQDRLMQAVATAANEAGSLADVLVHARDLVLVHDDWERARAFVPAPVEPGTPAVIVPFYPTDADREADVGDPLAARDLALAQECLEEGGPVWDQRQLTFAFPVLLGTQVHAVVVLTSALPLWRFDLIEQMASRVAEQLARVAERESAQAQLALARDEAMEASRKKSDFLATMSHEIRTPLHGVIGLNDLLLRTTLTPEQQRLATGVQGASRTLLGIINDILDFSKIEASRLELERLDFEVLTLLELVTTMIGETARRRGLDLTVACDPSLPRVLCGDPTRLSQVVTNLVANAVKFTESGRVEVRASAEPAGSRVKVRIDVLDTGIGVPIEKRADLFEPFTQADSSTTRIYGGSGLGLAISREIVAAMDGQLRYAPNPGGGSVFSAEVTLDRPLDVGTVWSGSGDQTYANVARSTTPGDKGTVLVVEDNPVNQLVAVGMLEALGYLGDTVDDGRAAVDAVATGSYDAVLMDIQMPGMDGYDATRAIRATEPHGTRVPIVAMTASAVEGERERCLAAGMDDFLTKPVDPGRLATSLELWVASDTHSSALVARLDLERLEELRELDDRGDDSAYLCRAITNFLGSVDTELAMLMSAASAHDLERTKAVAHRVSGSALNVGAVEVGGSLRGLEQMIDSGDVEAAVALLPAVEDLLREDVEALKAYRHHRYGVARD